MHTELSPRYDSRKSFYGKAHIEADYPVVSLWSYSTKVAQITYDGQPDDIFSAGGKAVVFGTYSPTTLRHIKEFLKQYGFKAISKSQIENDYLPEQN